MRALSRPFGFLLRMAAARPAAAIATIDRKFGLLQKDRSPARYCIRSAFCRKIARLGSFVSVPIVTALS